MRCLELATPEFDVDSYEVHQPGAGVDLLSPYLDDGDLDLQRWARDALALALLDPDQLPPGPRGPVPEVRRQPQRGSGPRPRGGARPALGQALRAGVRVNHRQIDDQRCPRPRVIHDGSVDPGPASRSLLCPPTMAVPKQKQSHARTAQRRAQHKITAPAVNGCPQCRRPRRPHRVCPHCGFYGGREVVHVHDHDHDHDH